MRTLKPKPSAGSTLATFALVISLAAAVNAILGIWDRNPVNGPWRMILDIVALTTVGLMLAQQSRRSSRS